MTVLHRRDLDRLERLGGTATAVHRAVIRRNGRVVVLKHVDWGDPASERLAREAEVLSGANHPSLVSVEAVLEDDVGCALVLAHCPGGSLADEIEAGRTWAAHDVADAGARLCGALAAVHATGFVHGDVHPGNIVLDAELQPVLIDLGEAQPIGTRPTSVAGHPEHVDHRLLTDASVLTPATDLHALATTLWTLVTGVPPPRGGPEAPVDLAPHPDVPEPLLETLQRCVDLNTTGAAALAVEFASLAQALAAGRAPASDPSPPAARAAAPPTTRHWGPPAPPSRATISGGSRPRRGVAAIAAVLAVTGVVVGGSTSWRPAPTKSVPLTAEDTPPATSAAGPVAANRPESGLTDESGPTAPLQTGTDPCEATTGVGDGLRVDIDGDGCAEPVTLADGVLRSPTAAFSFGSPGDVLLAGDWDGDGRVGVGLYRPSTGAVLLVDDPGPWARSHTARYLAAEGTPLVTTSADGARIEVSAEPPGPAP